MLLVKFIVGKNCFLRVLIKHIKGCDVGGYRVSEKYVRKNTV